MTYYTMLCDYLFIKTQILILFASFPLLAMAKKRNQTCNELIVVTMAAGFDSSV